MDKHWIALQSIPPAGKELILEDQELWQAPMREFGMDCRIIEALKARVHILPQENGVLFRGEIKGRIALPCDRCLSESVFAVDHSFDSFEPFPPDERPLTVADKKRAGVQEKKGRAGASRQGSGAAPVHGPAAFSRHGARANAEETADFDDSVDSAVIRALPHGRGLELNPAALVWEEFLLALPVKPLCSRACKGLCPVCGCNLNEQACACNKDEGDPRLAVLRGLNIRKD
ncbi:DUF177 domain-containing protein [Desulfovibrio sp. OttesenSCG-928-A18]|nr:DUF177 domain-containing protein [Desulfovibrio sp. OttesenSCG-928-A18]